MIEYEIHMAQKNLTETWCGKNENTDSQFLSSAKSVRHWIKFKLQSSKSSIQRPLPGYKSNY